MSNILDYYEYAKLATAAYVNLDEQLLDGATVATLANEQKRLPGLLADQAFKGLEGDTTPVWTIPDFGPNRNGYYGNDSEGFAATLFQRNKKINGVRDDFRKIS